MESDVTMRILQIAPPWFAVPPVAYGGIEWIVAQLADGMTAAGHDVTLFASGGSITDARLRTVYAQPPSERLGEIWPELRHAAAAYRRLREFDVAHDHSGVAGPVIGALLGEIGAGPPVVHTLHGAWNDDARELYGALPGPDAGGLRLVAISQDQADRAPEGVRIEAVVHNGIPVERFPFRGDRRRGDGPLAFLGRASAEKGPATAIRVAAALGRPLRMAVKVNEAPERSYWEREVAPLLAGAEGHDVEVRFNATFQEKAALLADADALLMPIAWHEPFGLVMAEAMACGTPVVAYGLGAAPEVVDHGRTGLVVPPGDVAAFCDAVTRVGDIDPSACRARVETMFSTQAMVDGYLRVYEKVLAERS